MATATTNDKNLDQRISNVEGENDVWNGVNTIGAVLAAIIGIKT